MTSTGARPPAPEKIQAAARRNAILDALRQKNFVSVGELSIRFDVSEVTVRRDLQALDEEGLLRRTHGGAVLSSPSTGHDPSFRTRMREQTAAKRAIGRAAAALLTDGDTVGIDVGTTTLEVANALGYRQHLTVFSASLQVALALAEGEADVYLLGGHLRKRELSLVGGLTLDALRKFHLDKAIIGAAGISATSGITESNLEDTEVKRVLIERARRRILVVDHSKFERVALAMVAPLSAIDVLVTDQAPTGALAAALRQAGVEVVVAAVEPDGRGNERPPKGPAPQRLDEGSS